MKSALCVDQLTLESVVASMGETAQQHASEEIPILARHSNEPVKKETTPIEDASHRDSDVPSDVSTVVTDAVESTEAKAEEKPEAKTPGFLERLVREYILRRDIQQLITKKQAQLKQMQTLMATYQEQLLKAITGLEEEAQQLKTDVERIKSDNKRQLAELVVTGTERARIEIVRSIGLVEVQRNRILQERVALRLTMVRTRQEECEWLLKSIVSQHEKECEELVAATTNKEFVDGGSLQATVAVQITENDPIFAVIETLFESLPQAKQLQLQLSSVDAVLTSMRGRLECSAPSGPVPLAKRASFREKRSTTDQHPTPDRRRTFRLGLIEGKRIRPTSDSGSITAKHMRYQSHLRRMERLLADVRTRTGSLLHHFVEKLHDDTLTWVHVTSNQDTSEGSNQASEVDTSKSSDRAACDQFFLPHRRRFTDTLMDKYAQSLAVDSHKLPPPAMVTSFVKFLTRVITTEYELLQTPTSPRSVSTQEIITPSANEQPVDPFDQTVLLDIVHEMVFRRLHLVAAASAMDEYHLRRAQEHDPATDSRDILFPSHWHHSKARLQQISPNELAFPDDVLIPVSRYLVTQECAIRERGFLPRTLSLLRVAERETTPRGVVRAVMAGFKMLHCELLEVLSSGDDRQEENGGGGGGGSSRRLRGRRSSYFLNADVLIPSVVLMISRLPCPQYLDELWNRVSLVTGFHSAALGDGGEESYYMTCLQAAMEFVHTDQATPDSSCDTSQHCIECESERALLSLRVEEIAVPAPAQKPSTIVRQRTLRKSSRSKGWSKTEHDSIKQLSRWISSQSQSDALSLVDAEALVAPHELWARSCESR